MEEADTELLVMESMYGEDLKVVENDVNGIRFSIRLAEATMESPLEIHFSLPCGFPENKLNCYVDGMYSNKLISLINKSVSEYIEDAEAVRSLDVCHIVRQLFSDHHALMQSVSNSVSTRIESLPKIVCVARFLIYFHHIMSSTKKKAIIDNARELRLGGISKTGFPGVVVVEGALEDVLEYVRVIQRLRWQHMVVRGEETEDATIDYSGCGENIAVLTDQVKAECVAAAVDAHRKVPKEFIELPCTTNTDSGGACMSSVGAFCKETGLHDLFMTAMKKYSSSA